jgi:hypothetical protein
MNLIKVCDIAESQKLKLDITFFHRSYDRTELSAWVDSAGRKTIHSKTSGKRRKTG